MKYRQLFDTRLFAAGETAADTCLIALSESYPAPLPRVLDADAAVTGGYGASFLYFRDPVRLDTAEDAKKLLAQVFQHTGGKRCFLWDGCMLEFAERDGHFCTRGDFSIDLSDTVTFFFPNQANFIWDAGKLAFRFDYNAGLRFSNYQYGDQPFSDLEISLSDGKMSFLFTVQESRYFAKVFQAGFCYGYGTDKVLAFPLIQRYVDDGFDLQAVLDFTEVKRSALRFTAPVSFVSQFFSIYGEAVVLTAREGAGFGFAKKPYPHAAARLVPTGAYEPKTEHGTHTDGILCGMSGTEYVVLPKQGTLLFSADGTHGAYAPKFPAAELSINDFVHPADSLPLSDAYTTAWVKFLAGTKYYSQPSDNPYYTGSGSLLDPAQRYTILKEDAPYVPIVPFDAMEGPASGDMGQAYGNAVIAPARAALLAECSKCGVFAAAGGSAVHTVAAPSGYLMQTDGNTVEAVLLSEDIRFEHPPGPLVSAFYTSGMLLVADSHAALPHTVHVECAGWNLDFSIGDTVLIVKSMKGRLYDPKNKADSLIANVSVWTERNTFSSASPAKTASRLMLYFEHVMADEANRRYYEPLIEAVTSQDWRGYLFIETPLGADAFPKELRSVCPDGDTASLRYFCAKQTKLVPGAQGPCFEKGAAYSGFVSYSDPAQGSGNGCLPPADSYAFRTLEIKAYFDKSSMVYFGSVSQLDLPKLCGIHTKSGSVRMHGSYAMREGMPAFSLQAYEGQTLSFAEGAVLASVVLGGVVLESTQKADVFTIHGTMQYSDAPDGDLFSYDSLPFSGYTLRREKGVFYEDVSGMALDAAASTAREGSLAKAMHLLPEKMIAAGAGFTALGYTKRLGKLSEMVCGIQFAAAIGSAGNLAPGQFFTVRLLAGWDAQGKPVLGIRMPDVLPLEGVLSLTASGAKLEYDKEGGFTLYFSEIALKLLGVFKLPPNGQVTATIREGGWFAAYVKKQ